MKKTKPVLILFLKLLVSAGLLAFFFTRIHVARFLSTLAAADFYYIAVALIIYLISQAVSTVRWTMLVRPLGFRTPYMQLVVYYLIGMFFNLFAPGTVGGDVTRVYYLARDDERAQTEGWSVTTVRAAISVFMDRALGMIVLIWLGAAGLLLFPGYAVPPAVRSLTLLLALGFVLAGLLIPIFRRLLPQDGHSFVVKLRLALRSYRAHWRAVIAAMALSLAIHLIQAWMHVVMGWALGIDIPFSYCIIVYPLVGTFSALPISLSGFGLREGGYLFLLGIIGIPSEKGVAFGLLLFVIVAVDSLLGGIIFLFKKSAKPSEALQAAWSKSDNE
jgi:uncharacterized protein (TIRG00374 family)